MKAPKKPEAETGSSAKSRRSAPNTAARNAPAAAATKEESASRSVKRGSSSVKTGSKTEKLERREPENVTPVGKETPLSTKPRKDASKGARQESKGSKGGKGGKTSVVTKVDVGFGNSLFIRGSGGGLNWDRGEPMRCVADDEWTWESDKGNETVEFKLLINDEIWSQGENFSAQAGQRLVCNPSF